MQLLFSAIIPLVFQDFRGAQRNWNSKAVQGVLAIPAETQKAGWCAELCLSKSVSMLSLFPCSPTSHTDRGAELEKTFKGPCKQQGRLQLRNHVGLADHESNVCVPVLQIFNCFNYFKEETSGGGVLLVLLPTEKFMMALRETSCYETTHTNFYLYGQCQHA